MLTRISGFLLLAALLPAQNPLEVVAAYYGADRHFFDVSDAVRAQAQPDGLTLTVGAQALGGDPMPGVAKTLRVYVKWMGRFDASEAKDGEILRIGRSSTGPAGNRGTARETVGGRVAAPAAVLTITSAIYGANGRTIDATSVLQSRVQENRLEFEVGGGHLADPVPGTVKELVVTYVWQGQTREARVRDGERLVLPPATPAGPELKLISATYGAGNRTADVLGMLLVRLANDRLIVSADNTTLGGDPARGANKTLHVTYEYRGQRYTASAKEGQILRLPPDTPGGTTPAAAPVTKGPLVPNDGACFYPEANYQGTPVCYSQDESRMSGAFGSVRLLGRVKSIDLFEQNGYSGRTVRLTGDQADLSQVSATGGGFFANTAQYAWAARPGAVRLLTQ